MPPPPRKIILKNSSKTDSKSYEDAKLRRIARFGTNGSSNSYTNTNANANANTNGNTNHTNTSTNTNGTTQTNGKQKKEDEVIEISKHEISKSSKENTSNHRDYHNRKSSPQGNHFIYLCLFC